MPYFNLHIMSLDELPIELKSLKGKYLKCGYLIFKSIKGMAYTYELSRELNDESRECYGGINFFSNEYCEFWIDCKNKMLVLEDSYVVSEKPWLIKEEEPLVTDFLKFNSDIEILKKI